ncbi:HD domain-containing phosphohydrolase [Candidatus Methylomirabilis sp.]|uniref:HD-GYP domain-containing protein n=1 Tax=Candidatus Methylomirabilis sp. TaxID=2032687 RepID=UPI003C747592
MTTGRLRVLVAEDNPEILTLLGELLEIERCEVALCSDGASALTRITQEPFDLILSDISMPGVSGLEILDRSSAMTSGIPVVLISGQVDLDTALFALRHGAFDCLLKPFRLDDIRDLVRRVQGLHGLAENGAGERVAKQVGGNGHRPQEILIRKSRALQVIARSGKVFGETHDLGLLMGAILEMAMRGVGAEQGALLIASETKDRLRVASIRGFHDTVRSGDEVGSANELWRLAGLPSEVTPSVIPLTVKGRQIGGMALANRHSEGSFSMADHEMLDIVAQQASIALENLSLYATVESTVFEGMRALAAMLDAKDPYTEGHSLRVAWFAVQICQKMELGNEVEDLVRYAGAMHDIGKIGIPDAILRKEGRLTPEEYERMKEHPVVGWKILAPFSFLQEEAIAVRHHHEWMNGGGYPDGLKGEEAPLPARILSVADAYDAMTTARPYRMPRSHEATIEELRRYAGPQFDPELVDAFASLSPRDLRAPDTGPNHT